VYQIGRIYLEFEDIFMSTSHLFLILAATAAPIFGAGTPPTDATAEAIRLQRQAIAAMDASLAAQRLSVRKQVGKDAGGGFFLLDAPARSGVIRTAAAEPDCNPLSSSALEPLIAGAARREDLEPGLLRSVVRQESAFRPCAVSTKGAMGLMQLMPSTAAQLGVKDPFDPEENLNAGARFLKQLMTIYNDLPLALGAYNAGPGRVNQTGGVPNIPETLDYIQKILGGDKVPLP
jgi:soluble lytic murein transglycosylase-like protein